MIALPAIHCFCPNRLQSLRNNGIIPAMAHIIAIIPARYHSTRFEGKALARIAGRPMIEWTYRQTLKAHLLNRVIVATDDKRIYNAVSRFGGEVLMTSRTHKSGTDRVAEVAGKLRVARGSIIVNVQGDEPLIESSIIDALVEPMLNDKSINMTTLSYRIRNKQELDNPNIVKMVVDKENYALYFSRSLIPYDSRPRVSSRKKFFKHIGLYAYRKDFLLKLTGLQPTGLEKREKLEQLRVLENGYRIKVVESPADPVEVDIPEDLRKVQTQIAKLRLSIIQD